MSKAKLLMGLFLVMLSGIVVVASFNTESAVTEADDLPTAFLYERLVPNTQYMDWCNTIASKMAHDALCITPHGSATLLVTDDNGTAIISLATDASEATYFEVAIAYRGEESPMWFTVATNHKSVNENQATLELAFEGLVPDADYTLWCVAITHSPTVEIKEQSCS